MTVDIASILAGRGATAVPAALATKARKILRAAQRPLTAGIMGSPPTITQNAAGASSTITNAGNSGALSAAGVTDTHLSTRLKWISGTFGWRDKAVMTQFIGSHVTSGSFLASIISNGTRPYALGNRGNGVMFFFDGQKFDVGMNIAGASVMRIAVTDLSTGIRAWHNASDFALTAGSCYVTVDFGARGDKLVECYFGPAALLFYGFCFDKRDQVYAPPLAEEPRIAFCQDSYGSGANHPNIRAIPGYVVGELLGTRDVIINGIGGTGFLNNNGGDSSAGGRTFAQRLTAGDFDVATIGEVDLAWMIGSVNDALSVNAAFTDAAYQAAVTTSVQAMMAAQPNAIIMVAGPQYTRNFQTGAGRYAAAQAGVVAAANGDPRVIYVDASPTGDGWMTGTGTTSNLVGDGSNDFFGATDSVHLNAAGNSNWGRKIALSTTRRLQQIAS